MLEQKRHIEEWLASSRGFLQSVVEAVRTEDWSRVAHADSAGWTARDVLAHVVGAELDLPVRHPAYGDMVVEDVFRIIGFHERLHADEIRRVIDETGL